MRIDYPTVNKNDFMSMNPVASHVNYIGNSIAPHADTERWSFVVPANQLGVIQSGLIATCRITLAAPIGIMRSYIDVIQGGQLAYLAYLVNINNSVSAFYSQTLPTPIFLLPGDSVSYHTSDLSTGGTSNYIGSLNVLLYNL